MTPTSAQVQAIEGYAERFGVAPLCADPSRSSVTMASGGLGGSSTHIADMAEPRSDRLQHIRVECTPLHSWMLTHAQLGDRSIVLVKIDIEGHELIAAATEAVGDAITELGYPQMLVALHPPFWQKIVPDRMERANRIETLLSVLSYEYRGKCEIIFGDAIQNVPIISAATWTLTRDQLVDQNSLMDLHCTFQPGRAPADPAGLLTPWMDDPVVFSLRVKDVGGQAHPFDLRASDHAAPDPAVRRFCTLFLVDAVDTCIQHLKSRLQNILESQCWAHASTSSTRECLKKAHAEGTLQAQRGE